MKNKQHIKQSTKYILFDVIKYASLITAALIAVIPITVVFFASLKTGEEYGSTGPITPPHNWFNFDNYKEAFIQGGMGWGFVNTLIILLAVLVGTILIGTMVAYVMDRFKFRGSKLILGLFLIATLIPSVTTQVATFKVISAIYTGVSSINDSIDLFGTHTGPILLGVGTDIMAIYIFLQFMSSIPVSLDEAAMLEGASLFGIYWRIILPLLKPAIATVIIIKGVAIYNEFYTAYLYMPQKLTISTSLYSFIGPYGGKWEIICAGIIIAIIPTLIAFLSLQKYFYNGFTGGAEKG